jgi:small subunit ribosomal protein S11
VEVAAKKAIAQGVREVEVYIKGPGSGRDAALRAIKAAGLRMSLIADVTPIPHNGPRPKKRRRV